MHVLAPNGVVEKFPYSIGRLRKDNPNTSFPRNPTAEQLAGRSVYPVHVESVPAHDIATQNVVKGSPVDVEGTWTIGWTVSDKTAEEQTAYADNLANEVEAKANRELETTLRDLAAQYSPSEPMTWGIQMSEAYGWSSSPTYPTPFIDAVIAESGESKSDFVAIIVGKAVLFAPAAGKAVGIKRRKTKT